MFFGIKQRHIDQWSEIENPEINPCIHGQFTAKNSRKEHLFNKWYYEKWQATCKRMKLDSSKWILELNIRTTTIKLRRNIGGKFLDNGIGQFFLYLTLKARTTRAEKKKKK